MSYKPLENVTIVFSTANITVCADVNANIKVSHLVEKRS